MKRLTLALLIAVAVALSLGANLGAQDQPARLAFVDSQALISLHPAGQQANQLRELASTEIAEIRTQLDDLSAKRATSVVRILQNDFGVDPARMTAAGRSYYVPLASNDTSDNRARNRRTRIVVLPKLDQFYSMIEEGMKDPAINK